METLYASDSQKSIYAEGIIGILNMNNHIISNKV